MASHRIDHAEACMAEQSICAFVPMRFFFPSAKRHPGDRLGKSSQVLRTDNEAISKG